VHRFSQALRLSVLDDLGLIPALRSLVNGLQERYGTRTELAVKGVERRLTPEVETAIFRIVQEALNNVGKHAQASEVCVTMEFREAGVGLTILDNGRGFDLTASVDALPRAGKLGLAGMRERARLLGGTFSIVSGSGKGTCLTLDIPAPKASPA
jgi:signal transduction histidine kinase